MTRTVTPRCGHTFSLCWSVLFLYICCGLTVCIERRQISIGSNTTLTDKRTELWGMEEIPPQPNSSRLYLLISEQHTTSSLYNTSSQQPTSSRSDYVTSQQQKTSHYDGAKSHRRKSSSFDHVSPQQQAGSKISKLVTEQQNRLNSVDSVTGRNSFQRMRSNSAQWLPPKSTSSVKQSSASATSLESITSLHAMTSTQTATSSNAVASQQSLTPSDYATSSDVTTSYGNATSDTVTSLRAITSQPAEELQNSSINEAQNSLDNGIVFLQTHSSFQTFYNNFSECVSKASFVVGLSGQIHGVLGDMSKWSPEAYMSCIGYIAGPRDTYLTAYFDVEEPCTSNQFGANVYENKNPGIYVRRNYITCRRRHWLITSTNNRLRYDWSEGQTDESIRFRIRFLATKNSPRHELVANFDTATSGSIIPPGFNGVRYIPNNMDAAYTLETPRNHVVMISFSHYFGGDFLLVEKYPSGEPVYRKSDMKRVPPTKVIGSSLRLVHRFDDLVEICTGFKLLFSFHEASEAPKFLDDEIINSLNSIQPSNQASGRRYGAKWVNCSVPDYSAFKQHLECNLVPECWGGEDEGEHCPFSPPGCHGNVGHKHVCYRLVESREGDPEKACHAEGGHPAAMKTNSEWKAFLDIFRYGKERRDDISLGIKGFTSAPYFYYRRSLLGAAGTVIYGMDASFSGWGIFTASSKLYFHARTVLQIGSYVGRDFHGGWQQFHACQFLSGSEKEKSQEKIELPTIYHNVAELRERNASLVECSKGHLTHDFLLCDPASQCGVDISSGLCRTVGVTGSKSKEKVIPFSPPAPSGQLSGKLHRARWEEEHSETNRAQFGGGQYGAKWVINVAMFACEDSDTYLHYTLVCDFFPHCRDHSDEKSCRHGDTCSGFRCKNGQCILRDKVCDKSEDCADSSDEENCPGLNRLQAFHGSPPPAVVNFDKTGKVTQRKMDESEKCPESHFQCPGELNHCLPVFVRCNGVYDCAGHEDEADCQNYTCPGFYRCRASSVCVHLDHLCDGWAQCPQRDDELLCDFTCPHTCTCQGLAFTCPQPFPAHLYPQLRYLDASHSGMSLTDLETNFYLIFLSLNFCNLTSVQESNHQNLQHLDVGHNRIRSLTMSAFHSFPNLRVVILSHNPLTSIQPGHVNAKHTILFTYTAPSTTLSGGRQPSTQFSGGRPKIKSTSQRIPGLSTNERTRIKSTSLKHVDLSSTDLEIFDGVSFSEFPGVEVLNMSHGKLQAVSKNGFSHLPNLRKLDLRGSRLRSYPPTLFQGLTKLEVLLTEDFELCCEALLPESFDRRFCFVPQDEISSCTDLLRSDIYRVFLWSVGLFAVAGNAGSFIYRLFFQKNPPRSGYNVFVTHLCLADLCMGVYLFVIGSADLVFRHQFILFKKSWTSSTACKAAGFLSLLSSEVSAFIICLITVDRFIVLRFPFSRVRFTRFSAALFSTLAWLLGVLFAGTPLLPVTSHWEFYGQTAICIPLPITRRSFPGRDYSFGVMVMLNFVLFVFVALGQGLIYWSVRINMFSSEMASCRTVPTGTAQHDARSGPETSPSSTKTCTSIVLTETSKKSQELTIARRLITVAVSDFLCWFPIGLLGLLAAAGVPISSELNVSTAVFVLPLNSALNPFLYTYNVLAERRRRAREERLMELLSLQSESEVL